MFSGISLNRCDNLFSESATTALFFRRVSERWSLEGLAFAADFNRSIARHSEIDSRIVQPVAPAGCRRISIHRTGPASYRVARAVRRNGQDSKSPLVPVGTTGPFVHPSVRPSARTSVSPSDNTRVHLNITQKRGETEGSARARELVSRVNVRGESGGRARE